MLRKQANPEHADSAPRIPEHPAMDLDPATIPEDAPDALQGNDILDDVFGGGDDDDEHFDAHADHAQGTTHHPSDVPRLQQEHTTAGYRDGITAAKATSIQAGFDEGFGLGATLGLRVGRLLGLLEGIVAAAAAPQTEASLRRLGDARAELGVKSVLGAAFWHADGTWKYEVGEGDSSSSAGEQEHEQLLFAHVVDAHPLVAKWTAIVRDEMQRLGLDEHDVPLLARHDGDGDGGNDDDKAQHRQGNVLARGAKATGGSQSQGEAKAPNDALSW